MIIAHETPETQIDELREAFDTLDTTKDGTITLNEFQSIIENSSSSFNLSEQEIKDIFDELDMNNTGRICYTDFLSATLESLGEGVAENQLVEAFEKLDVENNGCIEKEDIQAVLEADSSSKDKAKAQAEEILNEVDAKDGK